MPKKQVDEAEKLRKKLVQEQQKRLKPGECLKYIRLVVDVEILQLKEGLSLLNKISNANISHEIRQQRCSGIIVWERNVGQRVFRQEEGKQFQTLCEEYELEPQLLRIFSAEDVLELIENTKIHEVFTDVEKNYPNLRITLVVVGHLPSCHNPLKREMCFAELQILYGCTIYFAKDANDLGELVMHFTKAVAEIPFKKQKSAISAISSQFLLNDNKDCVRVEGLNGLGRLWQQHLSRLPLVTLDSAQAIVNNYHCPKKLLEEFDDPDGLINLANVKISRGALPLANERRIGEALSKKLFTLYNSVDPDEVL